MRRSLFSLALVFIAIAVGGCTSPNKRLGDERAAAGDWDGASDAYRAALMEQPGDQDVARALDAAERRAAARKRLQAADREAVGDLPGAIDLLDAATRLDPHDQASRDTRERVRSKLLAAKSTFDDATAKLAAKDPVAAEARLASIRELSGSFQGFDAIYARARKEAAASLRDRAARRLETGDVAGANADLAQAKSLESSMPRASPAAPDAAGGAQPLVGKDQLDAYARAAADVQAMTASVGGPRTSGLAKPEDYALPEEKIVPLKQAIDRAISTKPTGERQPAWLAHGRTVLQMSIDVGVERRVTAAKAALDRGDAAAGLREIEAARAIDLDGAVLPRFSDTMAAVRIGLVKALLEAGERAEGRGLHSLAKLRARQAAELDPASKQAAADLISRAESRGGAPVVALLPLQSYAADAVIASNAPVPGGAASTGKIEDRLLTHVLARLDADGASAAVLRFDDYRARKEAGRLPPVAAILRGEVISWDAGDGPPTDAAQEARIDALTVRARAARRRVLEAGDASPADVRAYSAEADEAERLLARAQRDRAAAQFEKPDAARAAPAGFSASVRIEARFQLYDPRTGRDIDGAPITRSEDGKKSEAAALAERVLDEAAEPMAVAIEAAIARATQAYRASRAAGTPGEVLDATIEDLDRTPAARMDPGAVAKVLAATGYSFPEKRTLIENVTTD